MCLIIVHVSMLSFNNIASALITETWLEEGSHHAEVRAGKMVARMWVIVVISFPVFGALSDKVGRKATFTIIALLCAFLGHLVVLWVNATCGLLLLGLSYSLSFSVVWGGVVFVVNKKLLG